MRVAVVAGVVVAHDAISAAVVQQAELLHTLPGIESVTVFTQHLGRDVSVPVVEVGDPWALVRHPAFAACDTVILHWGIHYALFDVVTLLAGRRAAVHFHNCTPIELVPESDRAAIARSEMQIAHAVSMGLDMWTFSEFNRLTLLDWGANESQISFVPFPVPVPILDRRSPRAEGAIRLLSVGRFVRAKGQRTLVAALGELSPALRQRVEVTFAGSQTFSDPSYVDEIDEAIAAVGGRGLQRVADVSDVELWSLYCDHDVVVSTSLHEGLCVPVIEGYAAGCIAIGTTEANLPYVVAGGDEVVAPEDPAALAAAVERAAARVVTGPQPDEYQARCAVAAKFSLERCHDALWSALFADGDSFDSQADRGQAKGG